MGLGPDLALRLSMNDHRAVCAVCARRIDARGGITLVQDKTYHNACWDRRRAPRLSSSQEVSIGLGARSRVHCSNSVGDTLPRELWGRTAL